MLYILLPVHNRKKITERFIDCLLQQTYHNYHLILIDDGSTDGTAEMVETMVPTTTVIRGDGSLWWAGSLQQGYLWLKKQNINDNDTLVILNDDVIFEPDYLEIGIDALQQHSKALIISIAYSNETGKLLDGGIYMDWKNWKSSVVLEHDINKINCASTRGLFMRVTDFLTLGGFYPKLLPHYTSDYEFTNRAYRQGYKLIVEPSLVLHFSEKTSGIYNFNDETSYFSFLRKLFSKKYTLQPFYMSAFVALSCPWRWKLKNWLLIWLSTGWKIVRYFFIIHYKRFFK